MKSKFPVVLTVSLLCFGFAHANNDFPGADKCINCHTEYDQKVKTTKHKVLIEVKKKGCESCHGLGDEHLQTPGENIIKFQQLKPEEASRICLSCHKKDSDLWEISIHSKNGISCVSCHSVHDGSEKLLKQTKLKNCLSCHKNMQSFVNLPSTHPLKEGKVNCSDCHSPHSNTKLKKKEYSKSCLKCHNEKTGPFMYEHKPVVEDCTSCHNSHGSVNQNLLTLRKPILCLQCHNNLPVLIHDVSKIDIRDCTSCHTDIHGSNKSDKFFR